MATLEQARDAKAELKARLAKVPAVNGIGIASSDEGWCVRVNVLAGNELSALGIPSDVDGVPVRTRYVGVARAYSP
jgi:hypothetical protein